MEDDYVFSSESGSSSSTSYLPSSEVSYDKQQLNTSQMMWKVAISPKEEHVIVLTSKQQIYAVSDITKDQSAESRVNLLIYFLINFFFWFIY